MTAFIVHKATGWLPDGRRITCEDWPTPELAIEALAMAEHLMPAQLLPVDFDALSDDVMHAIGIDPSRPFGCSVIVEN